LEIYAVELETKACNLIALSFYRAPSEDFNRFLRGLDATLKYLCNPKSECLLCGDINIDYLSEDNRKKRKDSLLTYNLTHTANFVTIILND
jgi:exonuclease III